MKYTFLKRAIFFVVSWMSISFILPSHADAAGFSLPPQLKHAGLSFTTPFTKPLSLPTRTQAISFNASKKLTLAKAQKEKRLEEIVVTPQVVKEQLPLPTPTIYIAPEITKTVTPLPSLSPSPKLYTSVTLSPTVQPTSLPTAAITQSLANPGGLNADKLFSMANSYRANKGLPALEKDERACTLASSRAPEINTEIAEGRMHSGLKARNLPYWNTENIISMNSEEAAFNWWINDTIHREAIEGNYKYSCVACSGNACAQEFTNFQPK